MKLKIYRSEWKKGKGIKRKFYFPEVFKKGDDLIHVPVPQVIDNITKNTEEEVIKFIRDIYNKKYKSWELFGKPIIDELKIRYWKTITV